MPIALWALGLVSNATTDNFIHPLQVMAIIIAIIVVVGGFVTVRRVWSETVDFDSAASMKGACMNAIKLTAIGLAVLGFLDPLNITAMSYMTTSAGGFSFSPVANPQRNQ